MENYKPENINCHPGMPYLELKYTLLSDIYLQTFSFEGGYKNMTITRVENFLHNVFSLKRLLYFNAMSLVQKHGIRSISDNKEHCK